MARSLRPASAMLVRGLVAATGAVATATGICVAAAGTAAIPGGAPTTASNDSVLRFYAVWWAAQGPAAWRLVHDPVVDVRAVRTLSAVTFCGGLARLAAVRASGLPHPLFRALTVLELGLPPLLVALTRRVAVSAADPDGPTAPTG